MTETLRRWIVPLFLLLLGHGPAAAQFLDPFDGASVAGWSFFTGDGTARMDFGAAGGHATVRVDATGDRDNIWWALVKRDVSAALDLRRLARPDRELRVEARIRVSHAPRRVNLHVNTQRTVDFHSHLMEFDIPDTLGWHTISMTTRGFDARPGDTVNAQLALMDWGLGTYRVDIDHFRVDVVDPARAGPDLGEPIPYHPPAPPRDSFTHTVRVAADAVVDLEHPELRLTGWYAADARGRTPVLSVGRGQLALLRWDLADFAGRRATGPGVLELATHSVQRAATSVEEYGQVRVVEVLGGDPRWDESDVTLAGLLRGEPLDRVLNGQMIVDVPVDETPGGRTRIVIPRPVLQRLLDGRTRGVALRPLGPVNAAFFAREHQGGGLAATLHFNLEPARR